MISYYLIPILIVSIIILIYVVFNIFRKRNKYTREYFAFYSLAMLSSMAALIITPLLNSESIWTVLVKMSNYFFKSDIKIEKTDALSQTIALIIFLIFTIFIYKIHKNWNGGISVRQFEEERLNEKSGIIKDSINQIILKVKKSEKLSLYNPDDNRKHQSIFKNISDSQLVWNVYAIELLMLSSNQYKIDVDQDWYSEYSCYISKYGKSEELIAIFCSENEPSINELDKFIKFSESLNKRYFKLIVVIKNGSNQMKVERYKGYTIEYRYEWEMVDNLVDFSSYYSDIISQFETEIIKGCNLSLKDVYVNAECVRNDKFKIDNIDTYIENWLNCDYSKRHIAILGDYGQGKSVYTLHLVYKMIKNRKIGNRIPILIVLRGKSPRNLNTLEIISNWAGNYAINPKAILKLHKLGKILLIFDGFDEMDLVGDEEMRLSHFQRLWEFAELNSKIIITGRPNFFLDTKELEIALGTKPELKDIPYCETLYLELFSKEQIEKSLRKVKANVRTEILSIVKSKEENRNFCDLIRRPSTLFLVTQIWESSKLYSLKEDINSALVIQEFIQSTYARQHGKNNEIKYTTLNVNEREYFMIGIAMGMYKMTYSSNQINKERLKDLVFKLYENFPNEISRINTTFVHDNINSLKERIKNLPQADETILTDVRSCGILVNDLAHIDNFKFAHKSFFEFLISQYYAYSILKSNEKYMMIINSINKSLGVSTPLDYDEAILEFTAQVILNNIKFERTGNEEKDCKLIFKDICHTKILNRSVKLAGNLYIYTMLFPILLLLLTLLIIIISKILGYTFYLIEKSNVILVVSIIAIILQAFNAMLLTIKYPRKIAFDIKIWIICCKELGIKQELINKLTPKYYSTTSITSSIVNMLSIKRKKTTDFQNLDRINTDI